MLQALAATPLVALPRRVHAEGKVVLMVGSSMMAGGFGLYLGQDLAEQTGCTIDRRAKTSSGLARPDFYDWVSEGAKMREESGCDVVVAIFGGNDGQGQWLGNAYDPPWIRYGEPEWIPEYRRRVNRFADAVAPDRQRLVWIGMPPVRLEKLNARVAAMNEVYESEMALRPNARFVRTWDVMSVKGKYSDHLKVDGVRTKVRAPDGVHVSPSGAHFLADFVRPFVSEQLLRD